MAMTVREGNTVVAVIRQQGSVTMISRVKRDGRYAWQRVLES